MSTVPDVSTEPNIVILSSPEEVDSMAAQHVIKQIHNKPDSVLTLPTGATPVGMYKLLVKAYQDGQVDFQHVTVLNLDEYWPISKNHQESYLQFMYRNFFAHINIPEKNRLIPNGEAKDPEEEATYYESIIQKYGPPDLAVLGIGPGTTCHIGFNEKGSTRNSRVRYVLLDQETRIANAKFFHDIDEVPTGALTQGIADILEAKSILMLAKGPGKAWGIHRSLYGPIGPEAPASFIRDNPSVTVLLDLESASQLPKA